MTFRYQKTISTLDHRVRVQAFPGYIVVESRSTYMQVVGNTASTRTSCASLQNVRSMTITEHPSKELDLLLLSFSDEGSYQFLPIDWSNEKLPVNTTGSVSFPAYETQLYDKGVVTVRVGNKVYCNSGNEGYGQNRLVDADSICNFLAVKITEADLEQASQKYTAAENAQTELTRLQEQCVRLDLARWNESSRNLGCFITSACDDLLQYIQSRDEMRRLLAGLELQLKIKTDDQHELASRVRAIWNKRQQQLTELLSEKQQVAEGLKTLLDTIGQHWGRFGLRFPAAVRQLYHNHQNKQEKSK